MRKIKFASDEQARKVSKDILKRFAKTFQMLAEVETQERKDMQSIINWAKVLEKEVQDRGAKISGQTLQDAIDIGVKNTDKIRILLVDKIPYPQEQFIIDAAKKCNLSLDKIEGITLGAQS